MSQEPMNQITVVDTMYIQVKERQRKKFDEKAMEELKDSIKTNGLMNPITLNRESGSEFYTLIAGERRLRAMTDLMFKGIKIKHGDAVLELDTVPAVVFTDLTEEEIFEMELEENVKRVNLTWQEEVSAFAALHKFRKKENPDHRYEDTAKEVKEARGDTAPVTSSERTKVRQAEILSEFLDDEEIKRAGSQSTAFKMVKNKLEQEFMGAVDRSTIAEDDDLNSWHRLYCMDILQFPGEKFEGTVSCVVTDPPYGIGVKDFGGAQKLTHKYSEGNALELYQRTADLCTIMCKPDAHVYIFLDISLFHQVMQMFEEKGWKVRRTPLIWNSGSRGHLPDGGVTGFRREYECILLARRGAQPYNSLLSDVIRVVDHSEKHHAAQKPTELYKLLLQQSTSIGDTVADFFAGSGVIFDAAKQADLQAIGVELSEEAVLLIESKHGVLRNDL